VARLQVGNVLTILGLLFLVPAMVGVIFVITYLIVRIADRRGRDCRDGRLVCPLVVLAPAAIPLETPTQKAGEALAYLGRFSGAVTAPSDAEETRAAYFAITPVA
jgi:4-amino-4-deoxy-L-arabinose transferase-like glycosyltransferase